MKRLACATALAALAATTTVAADDRLDLNSAGSEQLASVLTGVGDVKAERIVEYRERNGGFTEVDELTEVDGIGDATLEDNRDLLTVSE